MPGEQEVLVLDFLSQQMRLLVPLAKTYAYHFACEAALKLYAARTPQTMKDVHVVCAGLKSVTTWHKSDTLQVCRECCGGQGFSSLNKIGVMKSDSDVEQTYEGDNGSPPPLSPPFPLPLSVSFFFVSSRAHSLSFSSEWELVQPSCSSRSLASCSAVSRNA